MSKVPMLPIHLELSAIKKRLDRPIVVHLKDFGGEGNWDLTNATSMRDLELWMLGPVDEFEQHVAADELDLLARDRVDPIADNVPEHAEHEGCIPEKDLANTLGVVTLQGVGEALGDLVVHAPRGEPRQVDDDAHLLKTAGFCIADGLLQAVEEELDRLLGVPLGLVVPAAEDPEDGESGLVEAMHNELSGGQLPLHLVGGDVAGPHLLTPMHKLLQSCGRVVQVALPGAQEAAACRVVHSGCEACAAGLQGFDGIVANNLHEVLRRERLPLYMRFGRIIQDPRQPLKGQKEEQ
mmetsp:Transcript_157313/g.504641  ORF Transcript_157313/g.504641 Transcript_157313/m.504641 type:complete len:294 (+) Transcript_157313:195-1076(+)